MQLMQLMHAIAYPYAFSYLTSDHAPPPPLYIKCWSNIYLICCINVWKKKKLHFDPHLSKYQCGPVVGVRMNIQSHYVIAHPRGQENHIQKFEGPSSKTLGVTQEERQTSKSSYIIPIFLRKVWC